MRMERWRLSLLSSVTGRDLTTLSEEGEAVIQGALDDALSIIDEKYMKEPDLDVEVEVMTGRELLESDPPAPIRGQRGITERYRPYIACAAPIDVLGMNYVSVSEFDVGHRPEQGVAHLFLFWSRKLHTPRSCISDQLVLGAVPGAIERLSAMVDLVHDDPVSVADLKAALPYGIHMQKRRWLHRQRGSFVTGVHVHMAERGACLRADGVSLIRHFLRAEPIREAVVDDDWLLVAPGQAALVTRSRQRLDDSVPGMKYSNVSGNIMRDRGIAEDSDRLILRNPTVRRGV